MVITTDANREQTVEASSSTEPIVAPTKPIRQDSRDITWLDANKLPRLWGEPGED